MHPCPPHPIPSRPFPSQLIITPHHHPPPPLPPSTKPWITTTTNTIPCSQARRPSSTWAPRTVQRSAVPCAVSGPTAATRCRSAKHLRGTTARRQQHCTRRTATATPLPRGSRVRPRSHPPHRWPGRAGTRRTAASTGPAPRPLRRPPRPAAGRWGALLLLLPLHQQHRTACATKGGGGFVAARCSLTRWTRAGWVTRAWIRLAETSAAGVPASLKLRGKTHTTCTSTAPAPRGGSRPRPAPPAVQLPRTHAGFFVHACRCALFIYAEVLGCWGAEVLLCLLWCCCIVDDVAKRRHPGTSAS